MSVRILVTMVQIPFLRLFSLEMLTLQSQDVRPKKFLQLPVNDSAAKDCSGATKFVKTETREIIPNTNKIFLNKFFIITCNNNLF